MTTPIKRNRRSKQEIEDLQTKMYFLIKEEKPMTVRQVFYRMVSKGFIDKTENDYKNVICRLLVRMRKEGDMSYNWIADNTRWVREAAYHSSMANALNNMMKYYRKSLWTNVNAYVEIWSEKEAISGILYDVTSQWDVPLMVTRGYSSLTFLYNAGSWINQLQCPVYIYYFGDHDPSGADIPIKVLEGLREHAPNANINFELVAVTPELIIELNLPTRPTKQSDSRAKNFTGNSVEVDAIPPNKLRILTKEKILQHLDLNEVNQIKEIERYEKQTLQNVIETTGWLNG